MNISKTKIVIALLFGMQGCITQSHLPETTEQNQSSSRIEQVYVDGRLQFVVCQDCPIITPKQFDDDTAPTQEQSQVSMAPQADNSAMTATATTGPTVGQNDVLRQINTNKAGQQSPQPVDSQPYKKTSEWKANGVLDAYIKSDLYQQKNTPIKSESEPATKGEIDSALQQAIKEKQSLDDRENAVTGADTSNTAKQTPPPVVLATDVGDVGHQEKDASMQASAIVNFDFGRKTLNENANNEIEQIIADIGAATKIVLNGYTDSIGSKAFNDVLAMQRAINTKQALIKRGVKVDIEVNGKGNCCYLASNDTDAGRAKNRRVEVSTFDTNKGQTARTQTHKSDRQKTL